MIAVSLCALLFATYCYAVPVTPRTSTPSYEFTTGQAMIGHNATAKLILMNSAESTGATILQKPRGVVASNSGEYTTSAPSGQSLYKVPRVSSKPSSPKATMGAAEKNFINNFNKFQFTTMESKKQFQRKAFGGDLEETDETESKRDVQDEDPEAEQEEESKRDFQGDDAEAEQEEESKREVQDDDAEAEQEEESKREVQDDDAEAEEEESKREVQDDNAEADREESKRELQDDDAEAEEEESKREAHENDTDAEEEQESKRDFQDDDAEAEEEESKREVQDDDAEAEEEESKRELQDDDAEEEESKRALASNGLELTTSSFTSGSSSAKSFGKNTGILPKKSVNSTGVQFTTSSSKVVLKTPVKVTGTKTSV